MTSIAIVGRPNVGKSSLFNRFLRKRISIVAPSSGITRDRILSEMEWHNRKFNIVDTGGIDFDSSGPLQKQVFAQIKFSIKEAQILLFTVDITSGVTPIDKEISRLLRKSGKPVIVAANKADNKRLLEDIGVFYSLKWDKIIPVSAIHGSGITTLLDEIVQILPDTEDKAEDISVPLKVAVIGRPNTGKSTFINAVCGKQRLIVDKKPGSTRDAVDIKVDKNGRSWLFIDTGGMKRRRRLKAAVEYYSITRVYDSISRSDVVILMIDGWTGVSAQDARLLDYITKEGKGCVIAVNKWDLVTEVSRKSYTERIYRRLPQYNYIPSVFISALKGSNINKLLQTMEFVSSQMRQNVPTALLNKILHQLSDAGVYYGTQIKNSPPEFLLFVKNPELIKKVQLAFFTNQLHKVFGFKGVPIRWKLRAH